MESRHGVHTHAHRALREDALLSFSQPAGGTCAPLPIRRLVPSRRGGGGEIRFGGRVWVCLVSGLCCGGEGMFGGKKCSGDGGDFDEWAPAMALFQTALISMSKVPSPCIHTSVFIIYDSYHVQPQFTVSWLECVAASQ